jgi:hypothetical protein
MNKTCKSVTFYKVLAHPRVHHSKGVYQFPLVLEYLQSPQYIFITIMYQKMSVHYVQQWSCAILVVAESCYVVLLWTAPVHPPMPSTGYLISRGMPLYTNFPPMLEYPQSPHYIIITIMHQKMSVHYV